MPASAGTWSGCSRSCRGTVRWRWRRWSCSTGWVGGRVGGSREGRGGGAFAAMGKGMWVCTRCDGVSETQARPSVVAGQPASCAPPTHTQSAPPSAPASPTLSTHAALHCAQLAAPFSLAACRLCSPAGRPAMLLAQLAHPPPFLPPAPASIYSRHPLPPPHALTANHPTPPRRSPPTCARGTAATCLRARRGWCWRRSRTRRR